MSGHAKLDTLLMAGSGAVAADQIMQAIRDHNERHPEDSNQHYIKATIAGAIAIGAYEMLKKDEGSKDKNSHFDDKNINPSDKDEEGVERQKKPRRRSNSGGHGKDLLAQTLGAYALGRQVMGHNEHPIVNLVAEGLGVAARYRRKQTEHDRVSVDVEKTEEKELEKVAQK